MPGSRWQERQGQRVARRGGRGARQVQLDQRGQGRDARRDGAIDGVADQRELLQLLRARAARPWAQPYRMHTLTSALNEREGGGPLLAPGLQEQSSNAGSSLLRTCFWCVQAALPLVSKQFNHFVRTAMHGAPSHLSGALDLLLSTLHPSSHGPSTRLGAGEVARAVQLPIQQVVAQVDKLQVRQARQRSRNLRDAAQARQGLHAR